MMLSTQELKEGSNGAKNIVAYMKTTEYYRGGGDLMLGPARWAGPGVPAFGLVEDEHSDRKFEALLKGFNPDDPSEKLVRNAGHIKREMGMDFTFTSDKSVGILLSTASPEEREKILNAHRQAVEKAMGFLLGEGYSRTGAQGTGPRQALDGVIMRQVDHLDSRDGDPNLHTHCVLLNLNLCQDGKFRAIEMSPMIQAKHAAGALYRAHLAEGLRAAGYAIESERELDADERETGQVWHRVAGINKALVKQFSKRRQAIEKLMREKGLSAQEATLRTRRGKMDLSPSEIALTTRMTVEEWADRGALTWRTAEDLKAQGQPHPLVPKDPATLLATLHKTNSNWGRYDLINALAKEGFTMAPDLADEWIRQGLAKGEIIALQKTRNGNPQYCTKVQWDLEISIMDAIRNRSHERQFILPQDVVERAIATHEARQKFKLTNEQREMVFFATRNPGAAACLVGRAGTGKTASAGCYIEAYQQCGFTILGTSTAQRAAEKLASETGLDTCHSIAKMLQEIESGESPRVL